MNNYRITHGLEIWFAEEKTSFGWEMIYGTYADTEEKAKELLEKHIHVFRGEAENRLAAMSTVTPEEIQVLFQGERRNNPTLERVVWEHADRIAKLQLLAEGE